MAGFIYVFSNPSFKDGLLKIGKSDRDPSIRSDELYTTGVPASFCIEYYAFVADHHTVETRVHSELSSCRSNSSREFFACSVPVAIESIRRVAASTMKYEEIYYKDPKELEKMRRASAQKLAAEAREREERLLTNETQRLLGSVKSELQGIVSREIARNQAISKSQSLMDKLFRDLSHKDYEDRLGARLITYIEDVVAALHARYDGVNWRNEKLKLELEKERRSLTHLARFRLAEYYSQFFDDYQNSYWGLLKDGALQGPAVVIRKDGSFEQGTFNKGKYDGEFVRQDSNGRMYVSVFENNVQKSASPITRSELLFHQNQDDSHYSRLMKKN